MTAEKGAGIARQAAMLCRDPVFCLYLDARLRWETGMEYQALPDGTASELDAAEFIRSRCSVVSRAELDHNQEAARMFGRIFADFNRWKQRRGI
jgi:hypothetical protein